MADDSLLQLTNNLQEDVDEHYFDTYAGEDAEDASDEDAKYDDAFVQMSLKTHAEAVKSGLLQKEKRAPDDDEFDFNEDDDDDPSDFSVGQFLGDDDDDDAFIQIGSKKDDDDELADDRLGGEYILASDRDEKMKEVAEDDEEESEHAAEDALHEVLLQEARKHHKRAMTETKKPKKPKKPSHKAHKHPAMLGVTDVYSQLAHEEANGNGAENDKGWFGGDDSEDGEDEDGYSFVQTDGKDKDADDDDDDDSLADDRLDGGMDQILAATAES